MTILNRPSYGLPSLLLTLWKNLLFLGPMAADELLGLLAPDSLRQLAGFGDENLLRTTLSTWRRMGVFREQDGQLGLTKNFSVNNLALDPEYRDFRTLVRELVLHPSNATLDSSSTKLSSDFVQALAWVLCQDVFSLPGGSYKSVATVERSQVSGDFVFQNDTRWAGFRDWAVFLGFGWNSGTKGEFNADPTEAVEPFLADFSEGQSIDVVTFVSKLADEVPVLDHGSYRVGLQQRLQNVQQPAEHEISPSLTRALIRLEVQGRIRLQTKSDAVQRSLLGARFKRVIQTSHIEIRGGS